VGGVEEVGAMTYNKKGVFMRTIVLISVIVAVILIAASIHADSTAQYEITIKVKYNAVSVDRANEIVNDAQKRHADACEVEVTSKKVTGSVSSITGTAGNFNWVPGSLEIIDSPVVDAVMPGTLKINTTHAE
jgi:hypothetical protein